MKKSELKYLIKEIISEDIFLQNRKSPEEKTKTLEQELDLECKAKFGVEVYEGDIILTKQTLPYFKKYSKIKKVIGLFGCYDLELKSLADLPMPKEIGAWFNCSHNNLTSLNGGPKYVGGYFSCEVNKLKTLEGAPEIVDGDFVCRNNPRNFTKKYVRKFCDVKGNVYI